MKTILFRITLLFISIQLTAQTSQGIVSGMGKWVPIKTDFYRNNELVESEKVELNDKCIEYVEFLEGGVVNTKEYYSDCDEKKSEPGTYKYIKDSFYRITQNGETYNFKVKINDDEMQMITSGKDEDGVLVKAIVLLKRYNTFKNTEAKEVVTYYESGKIYTKEIYVSEKKNGPALVYWESGKVKWKGNYKNHKLTGEWIGYYENGNLKSITNHVDGEWEGKAKIISEDYGEIPGDAYEIGYYENNQRVGEWKEYSYNRLSSSGPYENDKKNGIWKIYFLSYSKEKDISATGKYLNGKREGQWKIYHGKGLLKSTGYYQNGKKIGVWKFYDKEGNLIKSESN